MSTNHLGVKSREFGAPIVEQVVPHGASRYGVVIGIDEYLHDLLKLRCAVADARAMFEVMVDEVCGCFSRDNVTLLLNADATTRNIGLALSSLVKKAGPKDTVWIYYAGHGAIEGAEAYWVTHDTDVQHLSATGLDRTRINRELSRLQSERVLILLDCCHASAAALQPHALRSVVPVQQLLGQFEGKGVMTLAASDSAQKSVELSDLGRGAFTYYLEKGLRGEADDEGDRDGIVTLEELWRYLHGRVQAEALRANNSQTPVKHGSMTGSDMALTLNARASRQVEQLTAMVEGMVGIRLGQLSTEQGKYCVQVVRRASRTEVEQELFDALVEVSRGELQPKRFLPIVQAAMRDVQRRIDEPKSPLYVAPNAPKQDNARPLVLPAPAFVPTGVSVGPSCALDWKLDPFGLSTGVAMGVVIQRMRWIPPGSFVMGSPGGEAGRFPNEAQRRVILTQGFWLSETPIVQAAWEGIMGENPSKFRSSHRPVERVSWDDCQRFIEKLNAQVPGGGFRLPTEAEWEYACRAGTSTATWVGDLAMHGGGHFELKEIAWYRGNSEQMTRPVRQKEPNPWGLYDMLGNVYEWCDDWYSALDVSSGLHVDHCEDPRGPPSGVYRVLRGGSWYSLSRGVRAALRDANTPDFRDECIGFRIARGP